MQRWMRNDDGPDVKFSTRAITYDSEIRENYKQQFGDLNTDNIYFYNTASFAEWLNGDAPQVGPMQIMPTNLLMPSYVTDTPRSWSRIGNKINVQKMEINILITANSTRLTNQSIPIPATAGGPSTFMQLTSPPQQGGETYSTQYQMTSTLSYLRTTYRVMVIKDLKANNNVTTLGWHNVMVQEQDPGSTNGGSVGGIMSFVKPEEWGRFEVLEDEIIELSSTNPQKVVTYSLGAKDVGKVRYMSSDALAATNVGIHVIWCAMTNGVAFQGIGRVVTVTPPTLTRGLWWTDE